MKGDGNFKWWCARNEDDEYYHGPRATREEIIALGMAELDDGETEQFYIMEFDKSMVTYTGVDEQDIAQNVIEGLSEGNPECWGEDGSEDAWSDLEVSDLAAAIKSAIETWLDKAPADTWYIGNCRTDEVINIKEHRA